MLTCSSFGAAGRGSVGKLARRPKSEHVFRLAKTAKQAMLVLSSMQPDAARRRKGRSKPDRVFRHSPIRESGVSPPGTQRQNVGFPLYRERQEITWTFECPTAPIFDRFSIANPRRRTATPVVSLNRARPNIGHTWTPNCPTYFLPIPKPVERPLLSFLVLCCPSKRI